MKQQLITVILTFTAAVALATGGQHHSDDIQALGTRREDNGPDGLDALENIPSEQEPKFLNEEEQKVQQGNLRTVNCSSVPGGTMVGAQCLVFNNPNWHGRLNWTQAKEACASKGQMLAHIEDLPSLIAYLESENDRTVYWLGGLFNHTEDTWLWSDGNPIGFIPWHSSHPKNGDYGKGFNYEVSIVAYPSGYLERIASNPSSWICAVGPVSTAAPAKVTSCSIVPGAVEIGNQCLAFNDNSLTWSDARAMCENRGQTLAKVEDMAALKAYLNITRDTYWIAAQDNNKYGKEGTWNWADGSPVGFIDWAGRNPNGGRKENCLLASREGYYDFDCLRKDDYICAVDVYKTVPSTPSPPTTTSNTEATQGTCPCEYKLKEIENELQSLKASSELQLQSLKDYVENLGCPKGHFRIGDQCFRLFLDTARSWYDSKSKCESEGLVMPKPRDPLQLRNYLVMRYGYKRGVWLFARGTGSTVNWDRDNIEISKHNSLWVINQPGREPSSGHCLILQFQSEHDVQKFPDKAYTMGGCTWDNTHHALCEHLKE